MVEMNSAWETPDLAAFGHSIPHLNFSFQLQSNQFQPHRNSYQESLLFYALVPMSLLLLLLLIYLFYFCARDWSATTTSSTKCFPSLFCSSITLSLYTTLIIALVYSSFFVLRLDFDKIISSSNEMENVINNINNRQAIEEQVTDVKREMKKAIELIERFEKNYEKPKKEMEKFKQGYPSYHEKDINVGNSSKASIDEYRKFKNRLLSLEDTRQVLSISVISILTIVALASWTTTCFKHPALFITSIILSFVGLLILHLALGLNLAFSIGLSDFCVEPANYIEETVLKADWLNQNEIKFFFKCDDEHPKFRKIQKLSLDLEGKKVNILSLMSKSNSMHSKIQNSLAKVLDNHNTAVTTVKEFEEMMDCKSIKIHYDNIIDITCNNYLLFWWITTFIIAGCLTLVCICLITLPMVMSKIVRINRDDVTFKPTHDFGRNSRGGYGSLRSAPIPQHDSIRRSKNLLKSKPNEIDLMDGDQSFNSHVHLLEMDRRQNYI